MTGEFSFTTSVEYEVAGVGFDLSLQRSKGEDRAGFKLTADDLDKGGQLSFSHKACPAVHDFVRGYSRWLIRAGIEASLGEDEVIGQSKPGLSATQLLQGAHDAVDMISQKFASYKGSVLDGSVYSDIVYQKKDGVAHLMINRPETYNAKRGITMDQMSEALLDAADDSSIRVVVLSGAGPNGFCTGNDQSYDPEVEHDQYAGTARVDHLAIARQMPQPVIAAVDGYAIGSGNILAYLSDFTIATTRSRFGQTGPRVGSPAASHIVAALAARVGQKRAREIWMVCRQYTAQEAFQMGLVNQVVEPDQLWNAVNSWVEDIKRTSPVILQMQRIAYREHDDFILPEKSPVERYIPDYLASEEYKERRTAFLERRPVDSSKNQPYVNIPIEQLMSDR